MSESDIVTILVNTKSGPVRGRKRITADQIEYASFQGIPYAKPPVSELRFKAPVPIDNWTEPIDALQQKPFASASIYPHHTYDERSAEDCLYLNVYTPSVEPAAPLPVMLYIHGGGFMVGSPDEAELGQDFLLRQSVILVTVAYRLGVLGFLSLADPQFGIPGNAGLKDQSLAMRWTRHNIAAFGGDPDNVTLFGESAGAASVHLHMLSDYSRGLFQRAILQSGNALAVWSKQPTDRDMNGRLARRLGWSGEGGDAELLRVLREADGRDLVLKQQFDEDVDHQRGIYFMYVPIVEPYGQDGDECFLPADTEQLAAGAWGNSIPLMLGCMSDECYMFFGLWRSIGPRMFSDDRYLAGVLPAAIRNDPAKRDRAVEVLRRNYYGDETPSQDNLDTFVQLQSDKFFWEGALRSIRARQTPGNQSASTYLYRFSFDSRLPTFQALKREMLNGETRRGAFHAEDLMYAFKAHYVDYDLPAGSPELVIVERLTALFAAFARSGDPNHEALGVRWEEAVGTEASTAYKCLRIDERIDCVVLPDAERLRVWDEVNSL